VDRITLGGQPVPRSCVQAALQLSPAVFLLYGSTETFLMSSMTVHHADGYVDFDSGVPVTGSSVRVTTGKEKERDGGVVEEAQEEGDSRKLVDAKDDNKDDQTEEEEHVPHGQTGFILFKRRVMMKGYLHDPQATAAAFTQDGFFRTGDVGRLDARGHLVVEGRGCDAIMQGPIIFYPWWLEERIKACPDVLDAMVVGVPERGGQQGGGGEGGSGGEEICACVKLKSSDATVQQVRDYMERDIVTGCEDQLSPRPRHYLAFHSFPTATTGKPLRMQLRQQASARLASSNPGTDA
jgi:acyl-CoA synthetase (AMP-forming)/AMP-acid ligase II